MNKEKKNYSIAAPICSVEELYPILKTGANEVYFGIMTDKWKEKYGNSEFITRRQSEHAHISSYEQLTYIIQIASDFNAKATLVLNADYSEEQFPHVLEILSEWEERGGHSVMVSDLGILLQMIEQKSRLTRYLSVMAGVFNHESVSFFHQLNVSRIVLPREMKLSEMYSLIKNSSNSMEFEVITMFQKCQYIDSFCDFIHTVESGSFQSNKNIAGHKSLPICHGCVLPFCYDGNQVVSLCKNEWNTPYCAACQLADMIENGVNYFKIAGRGYPQELILKAVSFTKNSIEHFYGMNDKIKEEYKQTFGTSCMNKFCYYWQ